MPGDIGDKSEEEHLKNPKTTHGAYLGLGLSAYIKNSSIHLVTHSLYIEGKSEVHFISILHAPDSRTLINYV
jgi:hypothetical protein